MLTPIDGDGRALSDLLLSQIYITVLHVAGVEFQHGRIDAAKLQAIVDRVESECRARGLIS